MSTVRPEPMYGWDTIRWKHLERTVFKLQKRIYRAQNRGEHGHCHDGKTAEDCRRYA
ncbi:MAG: reverse transcriptase N-terminal domain-containing protein [Candidatus Entotheonellia bacterium]